MITPLQKTKTYFEYRRHLRRLRPKLNFGSRKFGFLHIGKTGGSSLENLFRLQNHLGMPTPTILHHQWTMQDIIAKYKKMQIAFILRDPLVRTISGFNSRLRRGHPQNDISWSSDEAIVYSMFNNVNSYLQACLEDDEFNKSAIQFTNNSIKHIRRGYQYHFGSANFVNANIDRIYSIGELGNYSDFLIKTLSPLGIDQSFINDHFQQLHSAPTSSVDHLSKFSKAEIVKLKKLFEKEYEIYNCLKKVSSLLNGPAPNHNLDV